MVSITFENKEVVIRLPKQMLTETFVQEFIGYLKVEEIAQKSRLTEAQLQEIVEQIQQEWWQKNKQRFIKKIETHRS
jgi:fructoselysine-6-P-deglycase FrlB-like protein